MAQKLDGKLVAKEIKKNIVNELLELYKEYGKKPHLGIILVGNDEISQTYVSNKIKDCKEVGIRTSLINCSILISEVELLKQIYELNYQHNLDGYIIQLPLPKQINTENIIIHIDPKKDVDGFHPENFGKMALGIDTFLPATPYGILILLNYYKISIQGKHCVVIGRSRIVGKPMSILMGRKNFCGNATVTLIHSHTINIKLYTRQADIIIIALGIPNFLKGDMVKEGVIIIDVGINKVVNNVNKKGYSLVGDVDFDEVQKKASFITPVPGGVGPMTRCMLLKNTILAFKKSIINTK